MSSVTRYRACLVAFGAIYSLCFCLALPAFIDEAYTYNLVTDASLRHMLSALAHGADGAFPAYALFAFGWAKVFGASELSLRLTGGVFAVLFVWHCGGRLLRRFSPTTAGLALLVILATQNFIFYTIQARFYGMMIFLFSLVFWGTWDMVEDKGVSLRRRLGHGAACGVLCLSHPLGVVYAGILALLYLGFSSLRKTFSWANGATFLGGPICLMTWLPAFQLQRGINAVFPPGATVPGWSKYWEFAFLGSKVLFAVVVIGAALLAFAIPRSAGLRPGVSWRRAGGRRSEGAGGSLEEGNEATVGAGNALLIIYALAFVVALNVTTALLDAAHVIPIYLMQAVRYVLVCSVAYTVIVAGVLESLEGLLGHAAKARWAAGACRLLPLLILAGLLAGMATSWSRWLVEKSSMESSLARLAKLARDKGLEIVCEDHESAFFLAKRAGAAQVRYLLADDFPFKTLMRRIHEYYPDPAPVGSAERRQATNDFVFLPAGQAPVIVPRGGTTSH